MRTSLLVSLGLAALIGAASNANAECPESIGAPAGASSFGAATLLPGDLNGDGFGDLVVGSTQNGLAPGRAYIYFGAAAPDTVEDLILTGASNDDQFGIALSGIGDWNGDGSLDLAIGAPNDDSAGTDAGRVYVYFGGVGFDANPDIVLDGPAPGAHFGASIAGGRDLNGDGPVDVVVGAPTAGGSNTGAVYAYFGSPAPDATPDRNFEGSFGEQLGSSVALGDVNGDGTADLAAGAPMNLSSGRVKVYFGGSTLDTTFDRLLTTGGGGTRLGSAVAIGRLDGDAVEDVLVGAPQFNAAAGAAYVFLGGPLADGAPDVVLFGNIAQAHFGSVVATGPDVTSDGIDDFIVTAPGAEVRIYAGGPALDSIVDQRLPAETPGTGFGAAAALGQHDADPSGELIVGAPSYGAGRIYVQPPFCFSVSAPASVSVGATTTVRLCVRNCESQSGLFEWSYSDNRGWIVPASGSTTIAAHDSLCFDVPLTPPVADCTASGTITLTARILDCPSQVAQTAYTQVTRTTTPVPIITSCSLLDAFPDPGEPLRLPFCFQNPSQTTRTFFYQITVSPGFCPPLTSTVTVPAGATQCVDYACTVPISTPCGTTGQVVASVRDQCSTQSVQCSQTFTITAVTAATMLCPPGISAGPNTTLVRNMQWRNSSNVPLTYNYIVSDNRGWGSTQQGTQTLGAGQTGSVAFELTTPTTLCELIVDTVTLEVRTTNCPNRAFTCTAGVTCLLPTAVVTCAPDTVVSPGTTMRRMRWTNTSDFAAEFQYLITDANGWSAPVSGSSVLSAHQTASAVITLTVPTSCAPQQDVVTLSVNLAGCEASPLMCTSHVSVLGFVTSMDCPPDTLVPDGQASTTTLRWQNVSVFTTAYDYNIADTQGWGAPVTGSAVLAPNQFGTVAYTFVPPALPEDQVESTAITLDVQETSCSGAHYTCTTSAAASAAVPTWVLTNGGRFGTAVAMPGDLNADGRADLAVRSNTLAPSDAGHVQVFFGTAVFDATADRTMAGEGLGDLFGTVVVPGGDLNQDGFNDLVVGAPGNDAAGANAGRAYVYFGGPSFDPLIDRILTGNQNFQLGSAVAGVGDVNADGAADLLVGMPGATAGSGLAFLYFGGPGFDSNADRFLVSSSSGEAFGARVARCNDVNGDGRNDFLVGAPGNDQGGTDAGAVYVYFGGPGVDGTADLVLHGDAGRFGDALAAADIDADGFQDIVVGAPLRNPGGRVYVFRGGPGILDANADWLLDGTVPGGRFGSTLDASGDLDSDTYRDLAVGAPPTDQAEPGRVSLFRGGPAFDAQVDKLLLGTPATQFGSALASGTDFTGDSRLEIAVGAPDDQGGRVFLYTGLDFTTDTGPVVEPPAAPVTVTALGLPRDRGTGGVWIDYTLDAHAGRAQLDVFDISGRFVRSLVDEPRPAGGYVAVWDGRDTRLAPVSRGVYIVRMRADAFEASRKIVKTR